MEWGWVDWGWKGPEYQDLRAAYDRFFHHTLAAWCVAEDPDHAYWPSSPSSDTPFEAPNGQIQGDAHYWDVWHGRKPFTAYRDQYPRFMSEFGFQALPPLATIRTYADEADWNMTSYIMEQHQKECQWQQPDGRADARYLPAAEGFPVAGLSEHGAPGRGHPLRRGALAAPHGSRRRRALLAAQRLLAGGVLVQPGLLWPLESAALRRAPLLRAGDVVHRGRAIRAGDLHHQRSARAWEGAVRWSLETLGGDVLVAGQELGRAAPLSTAHVRTLDFSSHLSDENRRELIFVAELWRGERRVALQVATFVPTKHLKLVDPGVTGDAARRRMLT